MKKKVKKIPKYNDGTEEVEDVLATRQKKTPKPYVDGFSFSNSIGEHWRNMDSSAKASAIAGGIGGIGNMISNATSGKDVTFGGVVSGMGLGAATGAAIGGPWGAVIGGAVGGLTSAMGRTNGVNYASRSTDINDIMEEGSGILSMFGMSDAEMRRKANLVQNNNIGEIQTQLKRAEYAMNPNNPNGGKVMAAEGGIMRKPVDALVSKGELIYDPTTKKLRQVPGSKGKPNKADDVFARLYEGDVVISNSPTMMMANGKTPALNLMGMVDKYATGGTVKAREAIIKKVVNWLEANKTKPQLYAMYDEGVGNVESADDVSFDKDMYAHMLLMLPMINTLNFDRYNAMQNAYAKLGFTDTKPGNNIKKDDKVAAYQKLYDELTFGNDRINLMRKEGRIKGKGGSADKPETWNDGLPGTQTWLRHFGKNLSEKQMSEINSMLSSQGLEAFINDNGMVNYRKIQKPLSAKLTPYEVEIDETIDEDPIPDAEKWAKWAKKKIAKDLKPKNTTNTDSANVFGSIADYIPLATLFDKYDWHTESPQITPPRFVPVNADPRPLLRAADESLTMARYNQANISPNTGAGMAYGLQAASNRAKAYADAYQWQQETNNKLIAQNAGIHNDWRKQRDAYATQAIADTRANEGAAQQMRSQAIKDAYEFQTGRRNDRWKLSMLKPMFQYAVDDKIWQNMNI